MRKNEGINDTAQSKGRAPYSETDGESGRCASQVRRAQARRANRAAREPCEAEMKQRRWKAVELLEGFSLMVENCRRPTSPNRCRQAMSSHV
jgi:hypothetical protein